jgi:hypothetical protein
VRPTIAALENQHHESDRRSAQNSASLKLEAKNFAHSPQAIGRHDFGEFCRFA